MPSATEGIMTRPIARLRGTVSLPRLVQQEDRVHSELQHVRRQLGDLTGRVQNIADVLGVPSRDTERVLDALDVALTISPEFRRAVLKVYDGA